MIQSRIKPFLASSTAKLSGTYLAIILIMSLGFSTVLYNTSSRQLGRQLPPNSSASSADSQSTINQPTSTSQYQLSNHNPQLDQFLQRRIREGRSELLRKLVLLNISALLIGAAVSYALARRSLKPIEDAMDAQVQFVSDASHELRTPLTAIQTSNEVFLRRAKPTIADAKKLIEQNTDDVIRLKQLSDALLDLAQHKKTTLQLGPVKLQSVVSDAMTQIVPQVTAKDITVNDAVANVSVVGDHAMLTQSLVILLDNAVKYSNDRQVIHLETRVKGKSVYLDVRDEGIGIRASDIPHLFRRFYRADNARTSGQRSGYGLGLAIAKQIIDGQHGTLEVVSTLGKGSTFSIKLSLATA